MNFYDLNLALLFSSPVLLRTQFEESPCESRTNDLCSNYGVRLSRRISSLRSEIRWQSKCAAKSCWNQSLVMAFAQLTYRHSLRDIEVCLRAQRSKLYHCGFKAPIRRSTLAEANERRDWRIYADFARTLIDIARPLYADSEIGLDLQGTVYALDAPTIDLCLSVFPWATYKRAKGAIKLHTLMEVHSSIPVFIDMTHAKVHDIHLLDLIVPEPGSFLVMDRAYIDFARLYALHQALGFFVVRAKQIFSSAVARPKPWTEKAA
jgi:hypothetical protein